MGSESIAHEAERVVVKSFAGATTSDMSHYVKPTLNKKPDQIILHAGTNDIGNYPLAKSPITSLT